ncbi:MAG: nicotinate (nicotinamide) nucleotide adenylyltransferase [Verrucomicrobiaceae bacterium]
MDSPKIALFGGTFDPVHTGHLEAALKARSTLDLDQIIFLPCRQSPHKHSGPAASDQERLEMLQLSTADLPWAQVSDFELNRALPSYTWETIRDLKPSLPDHSDLYLLIGLDQWEALPRWTHPEKIAAEVEFIVVGRDGSPSPRQGYRAHFIPGDHPASASEIRRLLASKKPAPWLHPEVANFISRKHLYLSDR